LKASNLSDLTSASTARTNLGLGTAATTASTDYATAAQGTKADTAYGWGNHASAGYLTSATAASTYAPLTGTGTSGTWGISITGNAATVTNGLYSTGSYSNPTWLTSISGSIVSGNISGNAANVTGTVAIANGGSGQTTAQAAMNAFAAATTSGYYLRGNGTNVVMAAIQAADVPTLNQNTTGTAGGLSGTPNITVGTVSGTTITASTQFSGPGTGLTGTASSLSIGGNAATVTNGLYSTGSYSDPTWLTTLAGSKITGTINGGTY
jgi:hypothetical protein